jgi:hypothetical protein
MHTSSGSVHSMPSASTSADAIFQYASCKDPLVLSANLFVLLHLQKKATK